MVRDAEIVTRIRCYAGRDEIPALFLTSGRYTITRETLLTPEQAAVIAAAKVYCEASTRNGAFQLTDAERARPKLCAAVTTLRAQEGE